MGEIGRESDFVFMMVGNPNDVEEIVFKAEGGLIKNMREGTYIIDHTTSRPDLAIQIYKEAKKKGIGFLDAPVSGGDIGAQRG